MAKVLITGGAGFLGSHFADRLLQDGHQIVIVDNLVTVGNLDNIAHLNNNSNVEFVNHDIIETLPPIPCDYLLNMACPASPPAYQKDPVFTVKTAMLGTYIICLSMPEKIKPFSFRPQHQRFTVIQRFIHRLKATGVT